MDSRASKVLSGMNLVHKIGLEDTTMKLQGKGMTQTLKLSSVRGALKRFKGGQIPYLWFTTTVRCAGCQHPVKDAQVCN